MREIALGCAGQGLFAPFWSARILEEWARAAARHSPPQELTARGEIALISARWPGACIAPTPDLQASIYLPDPNDTHVLAAAISGGCDLIITMNLRDFPKHLLAEHGLYAQHPDAFLRGLFEQDQAKTTLVAHKVRAEAERLSGQAWPIRKLMKKARLPRLGKALEHDF